MKNRVYPASFAISPLLSFPLPAESKARNFEKAGIENLLLINVIEPAQTEWGSSIVLTAKSEKTIRLVVDSRKLSAVTVGVLYPSTRMDKLIDCLDSEKMFSSSDAYICYSLTLPYSSYWQKTSFTSHSGLYRFAQIQFGSKKPLLPFSMS